MKENYTDLQENMYKNYYKYSGESKLVEKIWSDAFGDNYPTGLNHFGFLTNTDLEMISRDLNTEHGDSVLDIGCGKGGPGLRLAEKHGLKLIGIDLIPEAIYEADLFKAKFDLDFEAKFKVGGFCEIPLSDSTIDVVISIDAFWMVHDKVTALNELKRVMKEEKKFVFTTWDSTYFDQTALLEECGYKVISIKETEKWKEYQTKVYNDILRFKEELKKELGAASNILISEATNVLPMLNSNSTVRRIYLSEVL